MMHNEDAMKKRDDRPLTKEDAKLFATKEDLKQFATKDDLARHANESNVRFDRADGRLDELTSVIRRQALAIVKTQESVDTLREDVIGIFKGLRSDLTRQMDDFMTRTLRVHHDNIMLVHRMDTVEGRVTALERRVP